MRDNSDSKIGQAKRELRMLFNEVYDGVYFVKMMEVVHENRFPHWILGQAIDELVEDGYLADCIEPLRGETNLRFIFRKDNLDFMDRVKKAVQVMMKYSEPHVTEACGTWTRALVEKALTGIGFAILGKESNSYSGKSWTRTGHSFDIITERDGRAYGCVVKNTFEYIDEEDLLVKLEMCDFLDLKPLFIMRGSPENFNNDIIQRGGYVVILKYKYYPPSFEALLEDMWEAVYLPVEICESLPAETLEGFEKWHEEASGL